MKPDLESNILISLNLFASAVLAEGYNLKVHQQFTDRMKSEIKEAVTRIIGEDEESRDFERFDTARNDLRAEQRQRLEDELGGGK